MRLAQKLSLTGLIFDIWALRIVGLWELLQFPVARDGLVWSQMVFVSIVVASILGM